MPLKSVNLPSAKEDVACAIQLLEQTKLEKIHLESNLSLLLEKYALEESHSKLVLLQLTFGFFVFWK